ncbi:MAG: phenylalanine--tRNA ligase subunit beta [bacterium]|nr:phenylalanine--tRNA ligase subunit beta [bacterium]
MLIPIDWLNEYISIDKNDYQIAQILTLAGLTIENTKNQIMNAEVTSNRPDWLSIYGIAREFSALTNTKLNPLPIKNITPKQETVLKITADPSLIFRFTGYVVKNIKIGASPDWLKKRLNSVGIRSINNVVDITNYIMIETGQPLHSFDLDKLGPKFSLRCGKKGETIATLDGISRALNENIIIAESNDQIVDLVGIMGGSSCETTKTTKNIFLQAAVFPPKLIRKSSKTIKLTTEASYRYERGVDYIKNKDCLDRAISMILDLCGGEVSQLIDIYPPKDTSKTIQWTIKQAETLLGISIKKEQVLDWLNALGIETIENDNIFTSTAPSWRFDINIKEDVFEEIARCKIINDFPRTTLNPTQPEDQHTTFDGIEHTKDTLINLGLTEIDGYSFLSLRNLTNAGFSSSDCLEASNPLSEEFQYLRPSLLPDMLLAVAQNPSFNEVALFEIGSIFQINKEQIQVGIIFAGKDITSQSDTINKWLNATLSNPKTPQEIPKNILKNYKVRKNKVYFIEFAFEEISKSLQNKKLSYIIPKMEQKYVPISKYPAIKRDLAIIIDQSINPDDIIKTITNQSLDNIEIFCQLFDEFVNDRFGKNKKSLAFHITYQSQQKTLTDQEIEQIHCAITKTLKNNFQAIPRI